MTKNEPARQYHIVGGGIAGLATAVFLVRDAAVCGRNIHVYEQLGALGGSLDGSGDAEGGYLVRGGRMFEEHFACTFDLLATVPSAEDPTLSVADDIFAFNRMVPRSGNCRIVRGGRPAEDRFELTLTAQDIFDVNRLILLGIPPRFTALEKRSNPIELAFSKIKALLKVTAVRTVQALWDAIRDAIDAVIPNDARNFSKACGYEPE